ncbi:MAG: hypothetical protein AB7N24_14360 [Dehalococcoidia bacterium]
MPRRSSGSSPTPAERLSEFQRITRELLNRSAVTSGLGISWELKGNQSESAHVEIDGPDEDQLRSFMMDLRKLLSNESPAHFPAVLSAARRAYPDSESMEWWTTLGKDWKQALDSSPVALSLNGVVYSPRRLLDLWINGELFHDDPMKQREWRALSADPFGFHRIALNMTVVHLVQVAGFALAQLNRLTGVVAPVLVPGVGGTGRAEPFEAEEL